MYCSLQLFRAVCFLQTLLTVPSALSVATSCKKIADCKCEMDDGSGVMDLTSLGKKPPARPAFYEVAERSTGTLYTYNPCYSFTQGGCQNAVMCERVPANNLQTAMGRQDSETFSVDSRGSVVVGYDGDSNFKSAVTLNCEADRTEMVPHGRTSGMTYTFDVYCPECCPRSSSAGDGGSLSAGSILTILFFTFLIIYVASGIAYQKFYKKQEVSLPNKEFWTALPGYIKDGMTFTYEKFRGLRSGEKQQSYRQL